MVRRGDGVCISISFNFRAWYRVEIRFSDNPRQKNTIDDIIWLRRKKSNLQIRYHFQYNSFGPVHGVRDQLVCRRDICRYPEKACQRVEKWQWLIISMWHLVEISEETAVYAYGNASNFKLEEPRCFFLVLAFVSSKGKLKQIVIHFPYETSNDIIQCYQFSRRILPLITPNGD